jgi:hypothetical protein
VSESPPLPFPQSLCHRCAAPPRYVRTEQSVFVLCPVLPNKYPRQPVMSCPAFQPATPPVPSSPDSPEDPDK